MCLLNVSVKEEWGIEAVKDLLLYPAASTD
jgi:hypothetical protein